MKGSSREEGLLPRERGMKWGVGVAMGVLGIVLLFGASTAFTVFPRALPAPLYLSILGTALVLIAAAYFLVR